ncbi:MAG: hypothetical protein AMXMBFR58_34110 [Phycisphaerae bacterium]
MRALWLASLGVVGAVSAASGSVIYEDVIYWLPNGQSVVNPTNPPTDAWIKVQETVYDDVQGRAILTTQLGLGLVTGPGVPNAPLNLYAYSITNMNYNNGPFTGGGAGVSGFNIVDGWVIPLGIWAPIAANSAWEPAAGNSSPTDYEWDIDANLNGLNGDGIGILLGQTFDSFYLAVPDGTMHGFLNAWAHSWSGGGALEQPASIQIDTVYGLVSGPIPSPGAAALLGLGGLGVIRRRR